MDGSLTFRIPKEASSPCDCGSQHRAEDGLQTAAPQLPRGSQFPPGPVRSPGQPTLSQIPWDPVYWFSFCPHNTWGRERNEKCPSPSSDFGAASVGGGWARPAQAFGELAPFLGEGTQIQVANGRYTCLPVGTAALAKHHRHLLPHLAREALVFVPFGPLSVPCPPWGPEFFGLLSHRSGYGTTEG